MNDSSSRDSRGEIWREVWTERDHERADWNGFESCFESLAEYERWIETIAQLIIDELNIGPTDVGAELGCGTGRVASLLARRVAHVYAFDYSPTVLDVARHRRAAPNITYEYADLNNFDPSSVAVTKAYAVGSLFYLDGEDTVRRLIEGFRQRGGAFAAIDLPDESIVDDRARSYDTSRYTHLRFSEERLLSWFPTGRVRRSDFVGYANSGSRFHFFVG